MFSKKSFAKGLDKKKKIKFKYYSKLFKIELPTCENLFIVPIIYQTFFSKKKSLQVLTLPID
jgi:hypothetical protein